MNDSGEETAAGAAVSEGEPRSAQGHEKQADIPKTAEAVKDALLDATRRSTAVLTKEALLRFGDALLADPLYQANVIERIMAGRADHIETLIWHHKVGKPPDKVEIEKRQRVLQIVLRRELGSYDPLAPGAEGIIDAAPQPRPPAEPPLR